MSTTFELTAPPTGLAARGGLGLRLAAAMFLLGPAAIHFAVAPEHLRQYAPYGLFFLLIGAAQVGLAATILLRPSSPLLLGGAGLSLAVIVIWVASRTSGLPLAPIPWRPEAVGFADLQSTFMEWISVWLLIAADACLASGRRFSVARAAPGLAAASIASLAMTLVGLLAVGAGGGH